MPLENLGFIQFEDGLSVGAMVVSPIPDEMTRILDLYLSRESRGLLKKENNEENAGDEGARSHRRDWVRGEQNNTKQEGRDYYTGDWKKYTCHRKCNERLTQTTLQSKAKEVFTFPPTSAHPLIFLRLFSFSGQLVQSYSRPLPT